MQKSWWLLLTAGALEIVWLLALKYSEGFTRLWPSILFAVSSLLSFYLLAMAIKHIPIGTAYAVWTAIGAVGSAAVGIILFQEAATFLRVLSILFIVAGIVGLKLSAQQTG
ncbi:MAG: multidrug efflux SMR transporter [Gammaproteobacteria bacterium]|nr:multidrug efflux SMR transporter [Gammaproteobacteria bacterium]